MNKYFIKRRPKSPSHKEIFGFSEPEGYEKPSSEVMIDYFNPEDFEEEND